MAQYDPAAIAVDKTLRDVRDVFYAWLQADEERDKDFAFNYAGAPMPMKMALSRVKQERFVEDTKEWEIELFKEEKLVARRLGVPDDDIDKMTKWESPLRKQVEISLKKVTYPLLQFWRLGPDFIFDLFRQGTPKERYIKTVAPRKGTDKTFEDEISGDETIDDTDYEGPGDAITADTSLDDF